MPFLEMSYINIKHKIYKLSNSPFSSEEAVSCNLQNNAST